jgi:phospholipid/cholesterol/gamma-HCH transport system substrate-binding protein
MARLGLFLVVSLAILLAGVFIIGSQRRLFTRSYRLQARFPSVSGLLTGAEVRIGGVRQGTVDAIQLPSSPAGQVVVTLSLDRATASLVKTDSLAAIETEGLLGNKYLAVSFGSPGAPRVKDGDLIASEPPLDVSGLLKKSQEIMDATHSAMKNLDALSAEMATLTSRLNRGDGTVGALLNDRGLYNQLNAAAVDARKTMAQARIGVTAFQEDMQALKSNIFFRGYFKDRGYQDAADLTRWELPKLPAAAPGKRFSFKTGDLFDPADSAKLKDRKRLNEVGAQLERQPFGLAVVQVFSGLKGDRQDNLVLTQAQAMVVRSYLAERFELDDTRLKTKGMGETTSEPGQEGRVVISIYAP